MDAAWASELQPITRDRWKSLVSAYPATASSWEVRRHHVRHYVQAPASACFKIEHEGQQKARMVPCFVENASVNGLMLQSDVAIEPHTAVELQIRMEEEIARLSGWVVHATETISGVKIGTHLHFDEPFGLSPREREAISAACPGESVRMKPVALRATSTPQPSHVGRLFARVFSPKALDYCLEIIFLMACVAGVSYVVGSMVMPALSR